MVALGLHHRLISVAPPGREIASLSLPTVSLLTVRNAKDGRRTRLSYLLSSAQASVLGSGATTVENLRRTSTCRACPSPKHHPACIFNDLLRPPSARTDDANLRIRRSHSPAGAPAHASIVCRRSEFWRSAGYPANEAEWLMIFLSASVYR